MGVAQPALDGFTRRAGGLCDFDQAQITFGLHQEGFALQRRQFRYRGLQGLAKFGVGGRLERVRLAEIEAGIL